MPSSERKTPLAARSTRTAKPRHCGSPLTRGGKWQLRKALPEPSQNSLCTAVLPTYKPEARSFDGMREALVHIWRGSPVCTRLTETNPPQPQLVPLSAVEITNTVAGGQLPLAERPTRPNILVSPSYIAKRQSSLPARDHVVWWSVQFLPTCAARHHGCNMVTSQWRIMPRRSAPGMSSLCDCTQQHVGFASGRGASEGISRDSRSLAERSLGLGECLVAPYEHLVAW